MSGPSRVNRLKTVGQRPFRAISQLRNPISTRSGRLLLVGAVVSCLLTGWIAAPMASASGTTLYVATPLNGGVDAGTCQNEATPCATIAYAVSQAATRDTIDVGPGTFTATLTDVWAYSSPSKGRARAPPRSRHWSRQPRGDQSFQPTRRLDPGRPDDRRFDRWRIEQRLRLDHRRRRQHRHEQRTCTLCVWAHRYGLGHRLHDQRQLPAANVVLTADMTITASTIANNTAGLESPLLASISVAGTILSDNGGADCSLLNSVTDGGYNIDEDGTCNFSHTNHSQSGVSPDLGTLQDNGGPTLTMAPASGSPALDQIPPGTMGNGVALCPGTDQRGAPRPDATDCDIGAVEPEFSAITCSNGPTCSTTVVTPSQTVTATGTKSTGTATVSLTVAPQALDCGPSFNYVAPVTTLTDTGLTATNGVEVTAEVRDLPSKKGVLVCYQKVEPSPHLCSSPSAMAGDPVRV